MGKKASTPRCNSRRYPAVLVAGGILAYGLPPASALGAEKAPVLRLAFRLDGAARATPDFRDNGEADVRLALSPQLSASPSGGGLPGNEAPARPAELPLRLSQILIPPSRAGRTTHWEVRDDQGLGLGVSQEMGVPLRGGNAPSGPQTPSGPVDALLPQSGTGRQPRSGGRSETGLNPEPSWAGGPSAAFVSAAADDEKESSGFGWSIPPIQWQGRLGYTFRQQSSDNGSSNQGQFLSGNLFAASYIYAPWLARVGGNLGVTSGVTRSQSGQDSNGSESTSASLTGSGNLDVLPSSRYPFSASLSHGDSRGSSGVVTTESTDTRLALRQSYRSEDGKHNLSAGYEFSSINSQNGQRDTVNAFSGNYSLPIGASSNGFGVRYSVSERSGTGEGSSLFQANSSHSLQLEDDNVSLSAQSNFTDNTLRYGGSGTVNEMRGQFLQLGTSAMWRPEFEDTDDLPLNLGAGLSYFGAKSGGQSGSSQSQQINGNLSAYYR